MWGEVGLHIWAVWSRVWVQKPSRGRKVPPQRVSLSWYSVSELKCGKRVSLSGRGVM